MKCKVADTVTFTCQTFKTMNTAKILHSVKSQMSNTSSEKLPIWTKPALRPSVQEVFERKLWYNQTASRRSLQPLWCNIVLLPLRLSFRFWVASLVLNLHNTYYTHVLIYKVKIQLFRNILTSLSQEGEHVHCMEPNTWFRSRPNHQHCT